jgi:two-component system sensor histidine kinase KdpD
MVDGLLDIQRIEEGRAVLNLKAIEVRVVLADAAQLVQPLAADANHKLQFDLTENLPLVMMDSDMMIRVVTNLLENAIKYTPEGGVIKLRARLTDEGVHISVRDSGPGIPSEMRYQSFDKFSRVSTEPQGVGLGQFCRLAVEAHGGESGESEPGRGAEFIFTLPPDKIAVEDEQLPP